MKRNIIMCALAGAALAVTTPAAAKPGGGGGAGGKGGASVGAQVGVGGRAGVGIGRGNSGAVGADIGVGSSISTRGGAAAGTGVSGTGAVNAGKLGTGSAIDMRGSTSARARANTGLDAGSARMGMNARAGMHLTGVTSGMTVVDSGGATIGTVTGVNTVGNGKIRSVQVTLSDGTRILLSPNSLALNGDLLTTTSLTSNVRSRGAANANINGLINASPNSVLNNAGVTTLTGLTTGLTVADSGGASLGTVSQVFVNRSGAVVGIRVALSGGGSVIIPATTLNMDGSTVITTFDPNG